MLFILGALESLIYGKYDMAYDLHIVKTLDWIDAAENPVTKLEIEALVAADPELSWSEDYVDMQNGESEDDIVRYHLIEFNGVSCFWWYRDQIKFNSPDFEHQLKLIKMAEALNAYVVGDDGEHYQIVHDVNGGCTIESYQP